MRLTMHFVYIIRMFLDISHGHISPFRIYKGSSFVVMLHRCLTVSTFHIEVGTVSVFLELFVALYLI